MNFRLCIRRCALGMMLFVGFGSVGMACTNFIVGSKASTDGSVICTYNADDYGMFIGLCHYPAGRHQKGEMRKVYDWDTGVYHGELPEAEVTYNVIGNINEWQVTIGETTYGGRDEMVDPTGLLDYGSLIYIALQRSRTAREAIKVMTTLTETYGYCSEGETFTRPERGVDYGDDGKGPGFERCRMGCYAHTRQCHLWPCQSKSYRSVRHER